MYMRNSVILPWFIVQSSEEFDTFLSNFEFLLDYIANRNPFVSIIIGEVNQGQTIGVVVIKQLIKSKKFNSLLPNVDLNKYLVIQLIFYKEVYHV